MPFLKLNIDDSSSHTSSAKSDESNTPTDFFHEMSSDNIAAKLSTPATIATTTLTTITTTNSQTSEYVIREPQIDDKSMTLNF